MIYGSTVHNQLIVYLYLNLQQVRFLLMCSPISCSRCAAASDVLSGRMVQVATSRRALQPPSTSPLLLPLALVLLVLLPLPLALPPTRPLVLLFSLTLVLLLVLLLALLLPLTLLLLLVLLFDAGAFIPAVNTSAPVGVATSAASAFSIASGAPAAAALAVSVAGVTPAVAAAAGGVSPAAAAAVAQSSCLSSCARVLSSARGEPHPACGEGLGA